MKRTAAALTTLALATTLAACSGSDDAEAEAKKLPVPSTNKPGSNRLTAQSVAKRLAEATGVPTLGHPTDNTASCSNKALGKTPSKNDCAQLVTTNTVSVYEFASPAVSAHWVKAMKGWQQVDRFALAYSARRQSDTSSEQRAELLSLLKKWVAAEK
ncbi:hypothetical protein ACFVFQ_08205 [Streptomyces sp. NPDC057743]|uniref:hypothetical protein n=1 Tax=Streptomyces sp. NPDC057743 TaxID=3346236 RepID=UPI0036BCE661